MDEGLGPGKGSGERKSFPEGLKPEDNHLSPEGWSDSPPQMRPMLIHKQCKQWLKINKGLNISFHQLQMELSKEERYRKWCQWHKEIWAKSTDWKYSKEKGVHEHPKPSSPSFLNGQNLSRSYFENWKARHPTIRKDAFHEMMEAGIIGSALTSETNWDVSKTIGQARYFLWDNCVNI